MEGRQDAQLGGTGTLAAGTGEVSERAHELLARMLAAHETWFDVARDRTVAGRMFPGVAEFHEQGERYVLTKRAKLWEVASNEYVFFDTVGFLEEGAFDEMVSFMKLQALPEVVHPHPDHMFSNLSLVLIADSVAPGVERAVRRVRFRKNHKLGLWGWSDLKVAVVDLSSGESGRVMTNAAGKNLRANLEANLTSAANDQKED